MSPSPGLTPSRRNCASSVSPCSSATRADSIRVSAESPGGDSARAGVGPNVQARTAAPAARVRTAIPALRFMAFRRPFTMLVLEALLARALVVGISRRATTNRLQHAFQHPFEEVATD